MSNRTMIEINHDQYPQDVLSAEVWLNSILAYLRTGNVSALPKGVTFFHQRHHSAPCPLGEPPYGWYNKVANKS